MEVADLALAHCEAASLLFCTLLHPILVPDAQTLPVGFQSVTVTLPSLYHNGQDYRLGLVSDRLNLKQLACTMYTYSSLNETKTIVSRFRSIYDLTLLHLLVRSRISRGRIDCQSSRVPQT